MTPRAPDRRIVVTARGTPPRLALLDGEHPVELRLFPPGARPFAGEILSARVTSIAREINAAFLISDAGELLLPYEKARAGKGARGKRSRNIADCVHEGESVAVRVIREADPGDGKLPLARLSPDKHIPGEGASLARLIADSAAEHGARVIIDERKLYLAVKRLAGQGNEITLWTGPGPSGQGPSGPGPSGPGPSGQSDIFEEFQIQEVIDEALTGVLPLASGGVLRIEPSRTLTAIDVDTGGAGRGRDAARTRLKTNIEAAEKIAWALRFLDIGGLVVIDFVGMNSKADQKAVLEALDRALAGDPAAVQRSGFSRFGLVELARQKRGPSLLQRLATLSTGNHAP